MSNHTFKSGELIPAIDSIRRIRHAWKWAFSALQTAGGLVIIASCIGEPPRIYWNGMKLAELSPMGFNDN